MANADQPNGFRPVGHVSGGVIRFQDGFKIEAAYATALFRGDAVVLTSGFVVKATDSSTLILGVFWGCRYRDSDGATKFRPDWVASTATLGSEAVEAFVHVDPGIIYRVQTDTGTAYVDATHTGGTYDIEIDHAGSAITGQSGMEIDLNDTSDGQFRVLGLVDEPGNAAGVNAKILVVNSLPFIS